jgi:hypothetical protein
MPKAVWLLNGESSHTALIGRLAPDRFLNPVERADTLERFGVQRIEARCVQFVELSSGVRPTGRLRDVRGFVDGLVATVRVDFFKDSRAQF